MNHSLKVFLGVAASAVLMTGAALAQSKQSADRMTSADNTFITKAAQGGMAEVALGKLAQTNASSDKVKQFGKRMVDDHTTAGYELSTIASKKGVTMPSGLDAKDQALKDKLSKLNGSDFDKAYMQDMVKDHRADVAEFKKEANSGQDADVKAFAAKTLPTLEDHLKNAESTLTEIKK